MSEHCTVILNDNQLYGKTFIIIFPDRNYHKTKLSQ